MSPTAVLPPATAIRRAIYGKLAGDSVLTGLIGTPVAGYTHAIYHGAAPQHATVPFVTLSKSSGTPRESFGKPSALETEVWQVKAIAMGTTGDQAEAIAGRVQALLNDAALSISGGTLLYCRRESDVDYAETASGEETFHHKGAMYRLWWEPA